MRIASFGGGARRCARVGALAAGAATDGGCRPAVAPARGRRPGARRWSAAAVRRAWGCRRGAGTGAGGSSRPPNALLDRAAEDGEQQEAEREDRKSKRLN